MSSIGAFAQISQVTHRMLRHWDTAGLLVPAHVDEFSGYRSYDPSQLERLHRIVALRQLGENHMSQIEFIEKPLRALCLAARRTSDARLKPPRTVAGQAGVCVSVGESSGKACSTMSTRLLNGRVSGSVAGTPRSSSISSMAAVI